MKTRSLCTGTVWILAAMAANADSLVDGSVEAGKAKAVTCAACHGTEGRSTNASWPNLAGQNAAYLLAQLRAFSAGERKDPIMNSQVGTLNDDDMKNLAVYFESLPSAAQSVANENLLDRGEALYRGGDKIDGTSACLACHGPSGRGNPAAAYPSLQGQHATYTAKQLADYATGTRSTDKNHAMRDIAATLSKDDIAALSSYVQGLK